LGQYAEFQVSDAGCSMLDVGSGAQRLDVGSRVRVLDLVLDAACWMLDV
jgi:hypothetical protein